MKAIRKQNYRLKRKLQIAERNEVLSELESLVQLEQNAKLMKENRMLKRTLQKQQQQVNQQGIQK